MSAQPTQIPGEEVIAGYQQAPTTGHWWRKQKHECYVCT
jgi:hypothetical protein